MLGNHGQEAARLRFITASRQPWGSLAALHALPLVGLCGEGRPPAPWLCFSPDVTSRVQAGGLSRRGGCLDLVTPLGETRVSHREEPWGRAAHSGAVPVAGFQGEPAALPSRVSVRVATLRLPGKRCCPPASALSPTRWPWSCFVCAGD